MMNTESPLFILSLLFGLIFIIMGIVQLIFPAKNINPLYGYRSNLSMKNIENWNFAQKYSRKIMFYFGVIFLLIALSGLLFEINYIFASIISLGCMTTFCFLTFVLTEKKLKKMNRFNS